MIYIASDHRGFQLKNDLKEFLKANKLAVKDLGPAKKASEDDFPVYAAKVGIQISKQPGDRGVLICGSGQGVCIAANKFKNVRAALCWNEGVAKAARKDDDTNVLCLPSDFVSTEMAEHILEIWLNASFSMEERHVRRLKQIKAFESK